MNEPAKEIPAYWSIADLSDCVQILDAHRIPINAREREERINGPANKQLFPYYGATGQVGVIDGYIFEGESVLLGEDGAPFFHLTKPKAYIVNGKYWVNNHAHILRGVKDHINNTFLCHYLNQVDYSGYITGTTRAKLTQNDPPYPEQQRIASKIDELFSELDAGVASLKRARALLKKYRQVVLKAAVTGELTRDWRKRHKGEIRESGVELLQRILRARHQAWEAAELRKLRAKGKPPKNARKNQKYKDSPEFDTTGLHELPEGWIWSRVQDVGDVQLGRQRAPQHHFGKHMRPYLRVMNVYEDRIDVADIMEMNFTPEEYQTYRLERGDILLNEGQSFDLVGRPAMYRGELEGACFTNTLVRFRADRPIDPRYPLIVFRYYLWSGRFQKIAKITTNIAHRAHRFADLEFPLPPLDEQLAIIETFEERFSEADAVERQMNQIDAYLAALRQSILKAAFSGKLVPQDPNDEPASVLLERIRAERQAKPRPARGRRTKTVNNRQLELLS
jgi:type I restriction enzyme, S subunit